MRWVLPLDVYSLLFTYRCVLSSLYIFPVLLPDFRENKIFHNQNSHSWKKFQVNTSHSAHPFCRVNENSRLFLFILFNSMHFLLPVVIFWCFNFQYTKWLFHSLDESLFLKKLTTLSIPSSLKYLYLSRFCSWLL